MRVEPATTVIKGSSRFWRGIAFQPIILRLPLNIEKQPLKRQHDAASERLLDATP
jgi:hypothetical protein